MGLETSGEALKWDAGVGVDRDGVCRGGRVGKEWGADVEGLGGGKGGEEGGEAGVGRGKG